MTTVIFEPHATSVDNARGIASGHRDVPLTRRGKIEARALGARYSGRPIAAVYCSDLRRARDTAVIAFERYRVPIFVDARLRECDYGELAGRAREEVFAERPRRVSEPFPVGESYAEAVDRVRQWLLDVAWRHTDEVVLVVGHNATQVGLEHWINSTPLDEIVVRPWPGEAGHTYLLTEDVVRRLAGLDEGGEQ